MGKITVLDYTTKKPITLIGEMSGICYGSNIKDELKNFQRGMDCIESNHGRTLEFPDIYLEIDGYSARVLREFYTHIGSLPTRLQASSRYIDYQDFSFVTPPSIKNNKDEDAWNAYITAIKQIKRSCKELTEMGIPREDVAMLLPMCMTSKMVDKRNLRNYIDMSHSRMCNRAYHEFRQLFTDISNALSSYSDEWKWIVDNMFMPKCKYLGRCPEKHSCKEGK